MAELEQLEIIIDVIEQFEEELNHLIVKLGEVETAVEAVDDITIDVDVRGERQLDRLLFKLGQLEAADMSGFGDVVLGEKTIHRSGGGGGLRGRDLDRQTQAFEQMFAGLDRNLTELLDGLDADASRTSRSMRKASDAADDAAEGFFKTDLRMTDLHNAAARLVPLLLVLIGAVPALYGAMITLAAAAAAAAASLAGLAGFAALGFAMEAGDGDIMDGFREILSEVRDDFLDAFTPLAQRLAPLFEDGLDGLEQFFQTLANEGDALVAFADDAAAFGSFLAETMPSVLSEMVQFVDATSEAFGVMERLVANFGFFESLAGFLAEVLQPFTVFVAQVTQIMPHLLEMSVGFLMVSNAVLFAANAFLDIITLGGMLNKFLGITVAAVLATYGAVLLLNSALLAMAFNALVSAGQSIIAFIGGLINMIGTLSASQASILATAASIKVLAAAIALTGIGALVVIFGAIAGGAASASTNIDKATKSLKEFQRQQRSMTSGTNPYADPDVARGEGTGSSRFAGSSVNVTVEGNADDETLRNQTQNALYRMERTRRSR